MALPEPMDNRLNKGMVLKKGTEADRGNGQRNWNAQGCLGGGGGGQNRVILHVYEEKSWRYYLEFYLPQTIDTMVCGK